MMISAGLAQRRHEEILKMAHDAYNKLNALSMELHNARCTMPEYESGEITGLWEEANAGIDGVFEMMDTLERLLSNYSYADFRWLNNLQ
jgi:hypothetical protein